ncbi:hypothetical protein BJ912DRAFT_926136 [Pholiota molesta]|nr:hypothetical protein BJ912DRAFT_926136 [Pholiota molesta]
MLTWRRWGTFAVGKGIWVDDGDGVESGLGLRPIGRERGRTHWVAVLDGASKPTKSLQRALFCAKGAGWMEKGDGGTAEDKDRPHESRSRMWRRHRARRPRPFQAGKAPQCRHVSTPTAVHAGPPNTMPAHTRRARRPSSLPVQFGGDARARRPIQTAIHPSRGAISAYAAPSAFSCNPHTYLRSFLNVSAYTPGAIMRAGVTDLLAGRSGTTTALYRSLMHRTSVAGASQQWSTTDHHSRPTPDKGAPQTTLHDGRGGTRMGGAHNSGTNIGSGMTTRMAVVGQLMRERWRVSLSHHNTVSYVLGILQYAGFCGGETRSDGVWWALVDTCAPIAKSLNCLLFNEVPNHKNVEKAEKTVEKDLYCLVKQRPAPCSKMGNKTNCSGPKIERTNEDRNCGNKISNSASHSWEHVI